MMDHNLLKRARANVSSIQKVAFNPMTPEAQAAAAQQGGAPPMDPAMAGGAPPMDPAMMGMDPAMAGGAPPMDPAMMGMDPAMMGMDPAMMGMDPAMMGGAPPEDPAAGGTPVTLNLEDLKQVLKEIGGDEEPAESKRATNAQIMDEMTNLRGMIEALAAAQGVQLPAGDVGAGADTALTGETGAPEDIAAIAGEMNAMGAEDPMAQAMDMGLPPGEMPPAAMPKMAVDKFIQTRLGKRG